MTVQKQEMGTNMDETPLVLYSMRAGHARNYLTFSDLQETPLF